MKKLITFISASALALGMSTALAAPPHLAAKANAGAAQTAATQAPSFLFVVSAKKGQIKKNKDGGYTLEIDKSDLNHVIQFSDRPNRIVQDITAKDLKNLWTKGTDSFAVDPPNASLSASNQKPIIVDLLGMKMNGDSVEFRLKGIKSKLSPSNLATVVMTVDGCVSGTNGDGQCTGETWKNIVDGN